MMKNVVLSLVLFIHSQCNAFIGGKMAQENQFPSVVWIAYGCTGSIIAQNKILVAAHCVLNFKDDPTYNIGQILKVYNSVRVLSSTPITLTVKDIIIHENWVAKISSGLYLESFIDLDDSSDLAVIVFNENNFNIHSIAKLSFEPLKKNQIVSVGGYGCENFDEPARDPKYKYAFKKVMSSKGHLFKVSKKNSDLKTVSMGCEGDSGGPVFTRIKNQFVQVGVNSSVIGDAQKGELRMVQLSAFKEWITAILK